MQEQLSNRLIGYRVRAAREAANWTQDQLANLLKLKDRQSISDLENGKRKLQPDELVLISDTLGQEIDFFLNPFVVAGEAQFSWRASSELSSESLDGFEVKAGQWIGLLRWLRENEQTPSPLKSTLRLTKRSTFEEACGRGEELAAQLELGLVPAERLIAAIERQLDIPVIFVDTLSTPEGHVISGATCHLEDMGVILINRNEPESRRLYDLAHELFHALTWDVMKPEHRESNAPDARGSHRRIEQLADNFAAGILMPASSLESLIDRRRIEDTSHLAEVAAQLRVAPEALAWRLFNLHWISREVCDRLRREHQRAALAGTPKRFSVSFAGMLHRAIDKGQLSARKAAKTIGLSMPQLADLFTEHSLSVPFEL